MTDDDAELVEAAIALVADWVRRSDEATTPDEHRANAQLEGVITDRASVAFAMAFVDRVVRPTDPRVAAHQLEVLVRNRGLPAFLGPIDRILLWTGARLAPVLPHIVIPLAIRRMRQLIGNLVLDARPEAMRAHFRSRREHGFRLNVNLLGEAVLGQSEADRRYEATVDLLGQPDVDYVSIKVSALVPQLNPWDHDGSVQRVSDRLRALFERAKATRPATFVNLDMEEYHDLELTMDAFTRVLDEPAFHTLDAGIVLQAYLPDSFPALQELVGWANERRRRHVDGQPGGEIKVRLVKGANLAMERVEAAIAGWEQAPYTTKAETDANYKRCLDWVLRPERLAGVRIGLASHNLFDVAWGHLLSWERVVSDRVELEMLQGMAPAQARVVQESSDGLLLYTPVVDPASFDVAISYLFRRLEENSSPENFLHSLFALAHDPAAFDAEAARFRVAVTDRWSVSSESRRAQDRTRSPNGRDPGDSFANEPDTDPALAANRAWANAIVREDSGGPRTAMTADTGAVDATIAAADRGRTDWAARSPAERHRVLDAYANELNRRRGDLVAAMVHEGGKTIAQADPEVSEAVDFARWYADCALELDRSESARFEPLGVLVVVPPWNFPVAIPAGGVLAALAAGNGVVLKPAPETPRCAEIVAECGAAVGVGEALQFLRTPDDDVGRHLITHPGVAGVILTGAYETARMFQTWKPDLRVIAETSGKNSMVITPNADLDLAVADLVGSAFGHSGQKCSAASLAICIGDVYESPRFRRQLIDAVQALQVGPATEPSSTVGPVIREPDPKLTRGLTQLDPGEQWLVEPRFLGDRTWTPGVRIGIRAGSWFHRTECFGPVLGLIAASDLDEALRIQNGTDYGLTGGIQTLDPTEIDAWLERVQVGNAYVNRATTGAIVGRQPFGGWKRSSVGPGAKAGGPNYVAQLGTWHPTDSERPDREWLTAATSSDEHWWNQEFSIAHDPTGLFCESNVFRYRPRPRMLIRLETDGTARGLARVRAAAARCGVPVEVSRAASESVDDLAVRLPRTGVDRIRVIGTAAPELRVAARESAMHLADDPVTSDGRVELLHYLREQSVSRTLHRHGNLL